MSRKKITLLQLFLAWSTDPEASTVISVRNMYLIVYGVLGFCQSFSVMVATAIAMVATLMAFNFIGDGLRDAIDPKER